MALYLAVKEMWRNRGRFFLIGLVIALITTLVLFVAALGEGLGSGNKEYLEKLNADLIIYTDNVDLSIATSRIDRSEVNDIRRVPGVKEVGPIGFSPVSIVFEDGREPLNVSMIGVEPGKPGEPPAFQGSGLRNGRDNEAIIDRNVALRTGLTVGDRFTVKAIQGAEEEFNTLTVVGVSDGRQYSLQPSVIVPFLTWDRIRPKASADNGQPELISNVVAVQLDAPDQIDTMAARLERQIGNVTAVDRTTAYQNTPGTALSRAHSTPSVDLPCLSACW